MSAVARRGGTIRRGWRLAALLLVCMAGRSAAQSANIAFTIDTDSMAVAPLITVTGVALPPEFGEYTTQLEIARGPSFDITELISIETRRGENVNFQLTRLLPERTRIHFRARIFDRFGVVRGQAIAQAVTRSWLRLSSPVGLTNVVLYTQQPTFRWNSSLVTAPPGPWRYDFAIVSTSTQQVIHEAKGLVDTIYTPTVPLEANTSFRWRVRAYLQNGIEQVTLSSVATFVISSTSAPLVTLFHNPFPTPFPNAASRTVCFWFDLAVRSQVRIEIFSPRGIPVKSLVPPMLEPGAYGRSGPGGSGCTAPFEWDGVDDRGRTVPSGYYIVRFTSEADRVVSTHKVYFKGR